MSEYIYEFEEYLQQGTYSQKRKEEIVRCRDCKHFTPVDKEHGNNDWCAKHEHIGWSYGGFCAWAERKVDE